MNSYDKKINVLFLYWLIFCLALVFLIIIIGGLTRLTNSGLSITQWELFKGVLPPLTQADWDEYFYLYKQIPIVLSMRIQVLQTKRNETLQFN